MRRGMRQREWVPSEPVPEAQKRFYDRKRQYASERNLRTLRLSIIRRNSTQCGPFRDICTFICSNIVPAIRILNCELAGQHARSCWMYYIALEPE